MTKYTHKTPYGKFEVEVERKIGGQLMITHGRRVFVTEKGGLGGRIGVHSPDGADEPHFSRPAPDPIESFDEFKPAFHMACELVTARYQMENLAFPKEGDPA